MARHALALASLLALSAALVPAAAWPAEAPRPGAAPAAKAAAKPGARPGARAVHPDTGGDSDCAGCHAQATPAAYQAWFDGKHGLNLVRCQVCHGSTGADFARRAAAERCRGCHGAQVDSLARAGMPAVKDCFACHAPHSLAANPHR
jgi:hypothetical protein